MAASLGVSLLFWILGSDGFGEVKTGVHTSTGMPVTVKVMNKPAIKATAVSLNESLSP
jgi:hypothetical protein